MAIPDYQTLMLPFLRLTEGRGELTLQAAEDSLAEELGLSNEERRELLPSGLKPRFRDRVGWAKTYLQKAGLLESPRRATVRLSPRGQQVLRENPERVDDRFLARFPEFVEFKSRRRQPSSDGVASAGGQTPDEAIESLVQELREGLQHEILRRLKTSPPEFFERVVIDLLLGMGYGGSRKDAGEALGRTGDGGIDGIIREDRLGLDAVYIQAKRWEGTTVGRPELQRFVGALGGHRARKGVFLTTSTFAGSAREYVGTVTEKVVLIDGEELARLMVEYGVGVSTVAAHELKKIDSDYFASD